MTFHFAPARRAEYSPLARALDWRADVVAANDDHSDETEATLADFAATTPFANALVTEALMHFGKHGLGAAKAAWSQAAEAAMTGDHSGYTHWLSICRVLDPAYARRMVRAFQGRDETPETA